jgi:adenylate cyclase
VKAPPWIQRLGSIGALPTDPAEERLRKTALVLVTLLIAPLAVVWVVTYASLGLWLSAAIPLAYQVVSLTTLAVFARTKRYDVYRSSQLVMMLMLPFLLQWSLGGFGASSAVCLWAFVAPLGALVFVGPRGAWPWFAGWAGLLFASILLEPSLPARHIPHGLVLAFFFLNVAAVSLVCFLLLHYFVLQRDRARDALDREHQLLQVERAKSERLLLNVLPESIATRLKEREEVIADAFPEVTVLFADIVGFTPQTERVSPHETVQLLNELFSEFDTLAEERGLEKIKTIGDAYMVAGGLPEPIPDHAGAVADLAMRMLELAGTRSLTDGEPVKLRIGIDSGPVVAGVIGRRKFIYDLWGDTVNTASRMESHGLPGRIQVTGRTRELLCDRYAFEERGVIQIKGKGEMATYLLIGLLAD